MNSRQRDEAGYSAGCSTRHIDGVSCKVVWSGAIWFVSIDNPFKRNIIGLGTSEQEAISDWREKMRSKQ